VRARGWCSAQHPTETHGKVAAAASISEHTCVAQKHTHTVVVYIYEVYENLHSELYATHPVTLNAHIKPLVQVRMVENNCSKLNTGVKELRNFDVYLSCQEIISNQTLAFKNKT
jgi:hypothetical protein